MTFHCRLPRGFGIATGWTGGHRTRGDAELLLEIFDLEPERQVLLAEVFTEELTEARTECGLVDDGP